MDRWIAYTLLTALLALPFASGHSELGTPDPACTGPTLLHDYEAIATGSYVSPPYDGNLQECGYTLLYEDPQVCGADPQVQALCETDRTADFDGDYEFAVGGSYAFYDNGDGATYGSLFCWGVWAHHGSSFAVVDAFFGGAVDVYVGADRPRDAAAAQFPCGDGVIEPCDPANQADIDQRTCNARDDRTFCPAQPTGSGSNSCTAFFPPGADGAYVILVGPGSLGHVYG